MATKAPTNTPKEIIESIEPDLEEREVVVGEGDQALYFTQKPLSFFGKIEFFSVVGKAVEKVLSEGGTLSEILDVPDYDKGAPLATSMSEADVFIKAFSKLVQHAPEILLDLYCVVLAVPRGQREYVSLRLEQDLDDETGTQIMDTFVEQNWEVLTNFFKERILPLANKIQKKVQG